MQCALKGHMGGRHESAVCREVFEEFDTEQSGDLTAEELQKVCATYLHKQSSSLLVVNRSYLREIACGHRLGNLLGKEGIAALYEELDEDGDGTVSLEEFEHWWERDVAPNQEINSRQKKLREVAYAHMPSPSCV